MCKFQFIKRSKSNPNKKVDKKKIVDQINNIIKTNYIFMGYTQFANYITKKTSIPLNTNYTKEEKQKLRKRKLKDFLIIV